MGWMLVAGEIGRRRGGEEGRAIVGGGAVGLDGRQAGQGGRLDRCEVDCDWTGLGEWARMTHPPRKLSTLAMPIQ